MKLPNDLDLRAVRTTQCMSRQLVSAVAAMAILVGILMLGVGCEKKAAPVPATPPQAAPSDPATPATPAPPAAPASPVSTPTPQPAGSKPLPVAP